MSADHPRNCSHIPKVKNWREVIEHWTKGSPQKNLTVPLKDWPAGTRTKKSLKFKYHDRKLIAWEYLALGNDAFVTKYSPDSITMKQLKKMIRDNNKFDAIEEEDPGPLPQM